ncbi:ATP-binding protein [Actinophytocola xanthii]|uniref:Uncharacterized protein n=1 Tax=Actinophytocola xanthii TaxID=1912961 RepID=A0A1Q8C4H8_9PSEU|nr:tetratricopeptide repeat protein [Actinophytocola xanthii]OLF09249.1 hypothetical protein BU204_33270 [Actinophytocola xanthii]
MVADGPADLRGRARDDARVYQAARDVHVHEGQVRALSPIHALPRETTSTFTGRSAELDALFNAALHAAAAGQVIAIHAIDGMAGIGKTALAIHAAHLLEPYFPDGQYFVRLHAHTPGVAPVEPLDALESLLAAQGLSPQEIPGDLDARAAVWRHRLAGRRTLLILDDAAGHQQVEPLLPGSGDCLVLITSRRRLAAIDAVPLPLHILPEAAAVELFASLSGRTNQPGQRDAISAIVRLCGHLPLAISLLASRLRHHPSWTAADLLEELKDTHDRLAHMQAEDVAVAAAFETSYRVLEPGQQQLFRRLGLHPGVDFDAYVAAALGELSLPETRRYLEALYGDHLLDEPVRGRYQMHDLIREYAGSLARETDQLELDRAEERLLDYYQHVAAAAGAHVAQAALDLAPPTPPPLAGVPPISDQESALAWFGVERASLLACVDFAHRGGQHLRVVRLTAAVAALLRFAGPWDEGARLHRLAVAAAATSGKPLAEAGALVNLGVISFLKGDYPSAREALASALAIYRELDDQPGQARALTQLGTFRRLTGDYGEAIEALTRALEIYRALGDQPGQAYALIKLGTARPMVGDYPGASQALTLALRIARKLGHRLAEADALNELGTIRHLLGDYPGATRDLSAGLDIARELTDRFAEAYALNELGLVRQHTGDRVGARAASTGALAIYREIGSLLGEADALIYLGTLDCVERDPGYDERAGAAFARALQICRKLGDRLGQAHASTRHGNLLRLNADHAGAEESLTQALRIYRELNHCRGQAEATSHTAALLADRNDPVAAMDRYRAALSLARLAFSPLEEARALEGLGRCARLLGDDDAAYAHRRAAGAIYRRTGLDSDVTREDHGGDLHQLPHPR